MTYRSIFVGVTTAWATVAPAQDQVSDFTRLAEECRVIRETAEDGFQGRALARPIADQLESLAQETSERGELASLVPEMGSEATACIAYARQISAGVVFDPERNRFVSAGTVRAQEEALRRIEEEERAALAAAEAAAQERLRLERQQELEDEVNARVFSSCSELAQSNPIAAYTNALCVQSFKANGLPEQ